MSATEVDVTVVVPTYNTMPYLTRTLESLVSQTLGTARMQVVAVDDGSTDGSGEELDRWQEQWPDLLTVVHQENSGGPAGPCNAGLDRARGRYVFFLGADDYLGERALELMVEHADRWQSDVLCVRIVGANGRTWSQSLYGEEIPDIDFTDRRLAFALSNTKLFRRALLEEHGIRYPLDLRIGSDQPFTVEAIVRGRRTSVMGSYPSYHAVRREDSSNVTYTTPWDIRLTAIIQVMDYIASVVPPGITRDQILTRHFGKELKNMLAHRFGPLEPDDQREMLDQLTAVMAKYYTDEIGRRQRVLPRLRYEALRTGRLDDLRALVDLSELECPVQLDAEGLELRYDTFGDFARGDLRVVAETPQKVLSAAIRPGVVAWDGDVLELRLPTSLQPDSTAHIWGLLRPAPDGRGWGPRMGTAEDRPEGNFNDVAIDDTGSLVWRIDVARRVPADAHSPRQFSVRLKCIIGDASVSMPVWAEAGPARTVRRDGRSWTVTTVADDRQRLVLSFAEDTLQELVTGGSPATKAPERRSMRRRLGALSGRSSADE